MFHFVKLGNVKQFNKIFHKNFIEMKGKHNYEIGDNIMFSLNRSGCLSEGGQTIYKISYDYVNDITILDFKRDREIKRNKSFIRKVIDFLTNQ